MSLAKQLQQAILLTTFLAFSSKIAADYPELPVMSESSDSI